MDIKISPSRLSGALDAVSSKSFVHRLLICAALAGKKTTIRLNAQSEDILAAVRCLEAMGCPVKIDKTELRVGPMKEKLARSVVLRCGESGTTARFVMPVAACLFDSFTITGEGKLPRRPFAPLCKALASAGCEFDGDALPITGKGKITSGNFQVSGDVSSQFASGLLFALPLLDEKSRVKITTKLESAGYLKMTIEAISLFGIAIEKGEDGFRVTGNRRYDSPGEITAEGDWSNAAFFLCMGALGGAGDAISVRGLSMRSEQGDKKIVEILRRFGASVEVDGDAVVAGGGGTLRGADIDATHIPDIIPELAVVAAVAEGETRIFNAQRLRHKESDRIQTTFDMLSALGADAQISPDGLVIRGRERLAGGTVSGAGDHRIVMAAATASCVCESPVVIKGFGAVNKSYPSFFGVFKTLGGVADVV